MKRILIFSSFFPNEELDYMKTNSIGAISNANDSFQKSLIKGFSENECEIEIINLPNIGAYPSKFKKLFSKTFTFTMEQKINGFNIGIININVIKHIHAYFKLRKKIKNLNLGDYSNIIIYDLYPPFIKLIKDLKKNNTQSNIVVVVPDIFGFTRDSTNILHKILDYFNVRILKDNLKHADGFVYLTELMKLKMPQMASEKKYIVVEGLINPQNNLNKIQAKEVNRFILYTGSLDIRHGILNLVEAFLKADFPDISLVICGDGEGRKVFEDKIKSQSNIKYLGQISRGKVLQLQSEAFFLVNPRTSEGEFTKYSFPSKVIEYFLSGTPTLMYRLQGIPTEYYDYCFSLEDESIECLTEKLLEISKIDSKELIQMANNARDFIVNNKNCKIQTQKILDLLNDL